MRNQWEEMWRFDTARFVVKWEVTPSDDVDISWDETGEVQDNLASGLWCAFDSRIVVELDGRVIGEDYLGGSIYENPSEFRDHIGMNKRGHGSYFSDMVREAIKDARKTLASTPHIRATV
jgi:hypothetical protein